MMTRTTPITDPDPAADHESSDTGVEGNARLTGATGALLVFLLFLEGLTILRIRELIGFHIFLGLLIVPPLMLKSASTGYRFIRYYTGRAPYVRKGPPDLFLRITGPFVVTSTFAVIATGIGLLVVSPEHPGILHAAHKGSFIAWFAFMTLHVLGHLRETVRLAARDWLPRRAHERARGRSVRRALIALTLIAGVGLGAAVLPSASKWTHGRLARQDDEGTRAR